MNACPRCNKELSTQNLCFDCGMRYSVRQLQKAELRKILKRDGKQTARMDEGAEDYILRSVEEAVSKVEHPKPHILDILP